ncbi:MAG: hypothetical protein ABWY25_01395 [Paenisporosarcina sp.]
MRRILVLLFVFGVGGVQTPPTPSGLRITSNTITPEPPLAPNEPFHVTANHSAAWFKYDTDGTTAIPCGVTPPASNCFADTTAYNLVINGTTYMTKSWTQAGNGFVDFYMSAGLAAGSYSIVVQSVGPGGTSSAATVTLPIVQR